ncbi:MAG TPA: hypothetical protein VHU13_05375 [Solirubrobacteraceae bacterium]|nr:hypothetical protein [Solirubrobacteraceae bacterium]
MFDPDRLDRPDVRLEGSYSRVARASDRARRAGGVAKDSRRPGPLDAVQAVGEIADERRRPLLAAYRGRLSHDELDDCYSQATVELLMRARHGRPFASREHVANALAQRLLARIHDRRRAVSGRSPIEAAIACALPFGACERGGERTAGQIVDERADVEQIALRRHELRRIARLAGTLTRDQRLFLAAQIVGDQSPSEFCRAQGWTLEKYRKVGQRARARLLAGDSPSRSKAGRSALSRSAAGGRINEQGHVYDKHSPNT